MCSSRKDRAEMRGTQRLFLLRYLLLLIGLLTMVTGGRRAEPAPRPQTSQLTGPGKYYGGQMDILARLSAGADEKRGVGCQLIDSWYHP